MAESTSLETTVYHLYSRVAAYFEDAGSHTETPTGEQLPADAGDHFLSSEEDESFLSRALRNLCEKNPLACLAVSSEVACSGPDVAIGEDNDEDEDDDGYCNEEHLGDADCEHPETDCDDTRKDINPGVAEKCDGVDNNCDNETDEGVTSQYYEDDDGDQYGDPQDSVVACDNPTTDTEKFVTNDGDCDDTDPQINPTNAWYRDDDGDGYGNFSDSKTACEQPSGYVPDFRNL